MDQLIPIVNKLQDVFGALGVESIDLPQITVVGSQSAGKSSVLENIVGRDFLPRGVGIVTRRPLVLQLYSINPAELPPNERQYGEEWGEFLHIPGQKFYDFNQIREEIERETDRITGKNKGISNKSINLKIFSPHVLNLTLVDLPGITKVPTGDQPDDVEDQIRNMCLEFISNPNAIILAVTAANQDLANSDGLKLARSVDPEGERTIGVLTKVDIMDQGTDCSDILENRVIPLRLGYIAVINRSQRDITENLSIRKGLAKEQAYFQGHPKYSRIMSKCGTKNLSRCLNQLLMHHIRDCLPGIKHRINKMMTNVETNLDALGESIDDLSPVEKSGKVLKMIETFHRTFVDILTGKRSKDGRSEMTELYGGARIIYIFNEVFAKRLSTVDPLDGVTEEKLRMSISNFNGLRPAMFVSEGSFDNIVREQVARLEYPSLQCLDLVVEEVQRMILDSTMVDLSRFPELRDRIMEVSMILLRKCLAPASKMISSLIDVEKDFINTNHPDFIGGRAAAAAAQNRKAAASSTSANGDVSSVNGANGSVAGVSNGAMGGATAATAGANAGAAVPPPSPSNSGLDTPNKGNFVMFRPGQVQKASANAGGPHPANGHGHHGSAALAAATGPRTPGPMSPLGSRSKMDDEDAHIVRLPMVPETLRPTSTMTERERTEVDIVKILIRSYFDIVKKNLTDLIPKTIVRFLVNTFKDSLHNQLVAELYKEIEMKDLMRETEEIASKRKAFREMRELLVRASEIVNEVREFQPASL